MGAKKNREVSIKAKRRLCWLMIVILFFDLLFIYFSKYSHKNLSIREFNPASMGNILNFVFTFLPALGLLILSFKPGRLDMRKLYAMLTISVIMNLFLGLTLVIKEFRLPMPFEYLFGYPIEKIYEVLLYSAFQYFVFFLTMFIWLLVFKYSGYLYIGSFFYTLFTIFLLILWAFVYSNDYEDKTGLYEKGKKKSDCAVVLGAAVWSKNKPSPILAGRIRKANNLYSAGIVKKIQVTGGNAPGELTEAEVAYKYLVRFGVEPKDIWVEKKTSSTSEQVEFIKENLIKKKKLENIIIVSDHFHLKRVIEICSFFNLKADGIASDLNMTWESSLFYRFRDSIALLIFWLFAL